MVDPTRRLRWLPARESVVIDQFAVHGRLGRLIVGITFVFGVFCLPPVTAATHVGAPPLLAFWCILAAWLAAANRLLRAHAYASQAAFLLLVFGNTDLLPVLLALGSLGNRWLAPEGVLLTVIDPESGDAMEVAVIDRKTSRPLRAGRVARRAGPGAKKRPRERLQEPLVLGVQSRAHVGGRRGQTKHHRT